MKSSVGLWALGLMLVGCRTVVDLNPRPVVEEKISGPKREGCDVHEWTNATDVPAGAKSMGTIKVDRQKTDEETYDALRKVICEKGGDGFSALHWVKEPGVWEPVALEATVWELP